MDDPNITMEEYIMLEEEKARRPGKVYNWETTTYVFNDTLMSEPMVSSLNIEIDFRISFDESNDEDYTVIYDKNSFSYKINYVDDLKTNLENDNDKVNMPLFLSLEPTVSYFEDLDYFKDFEKEFPAIVYKDALTSKLDFLTEPTVIPKHVDEFSLKDETSLSEYDEEEQNILYFNDLFHFNVIYPDDTKSDKDNADDKIDIKQSLMEYTVNDLALSVRHSTYFETLHDQESIEDFVQRFKAESRQVKGVPECMRIYGFMHEITNPELIKRLYDKILKSVDEMIRVTIAFLRGDVAASNQAWKKTLSAWKQQETGRKQNFEKRGDFRNQQRSERRPDNFTLLLKSLKETLALDKGKFKAPTPMTIPLEKETTISFASSGSKKPNGSSYHTPHWLQWRNHIANGTNINAGKMRVCGAFRIYMDEFCGSKIIISVQWDHRKAESEEYSNSPINRSRDVKIPSLRRNTHSVKQQDHPTRMHDGLRTRSIAFRYHSDGKRKNQIGYSSGIS
nr:reverse transcriptase domain-containing protein [Tanacetum cinerariifolium]